MRSLSPLSQSHPVRIHIELIENFSLLMPYIKCFEMVQCILDRLLDDIRLSELKTWAHRQKTHEFLRETEWLSQAIDETNGKERKKKQKVNAMKKEMMWICGAHHNSRQFFRMESTSELKRSLFWQI